MGAVLVALAAVEGIGVVHGVVAVEEVPAVDVIDVAVVVIVDVVTRDLARIGPDVIPEIWVVDVYALVDHRNYRARAAGGRIPGFRLSLIHI